MCLASALGSGSALCVLSRTQLVVCSGGWLPRSAVGFRGGSRLGRARSPPPPFRDFIEAESKPWPTSPATPLPPEPSEGPDLWGAVLSFLQYGYVAVVMGLFAYFMVVIERQNEIMESMKSRIAILEVQCRHAT